MFSCIKLGVCDRTRGLTGISANVVGMEEWRTRFDLSAAARSRGGPRAALGVREGEGRETGGSSDGL